MLAAHVAAKAPLAANGLLVLTGALPALQGGTPGMIGYGISKAATHFLLSMFGFAEYFFFSLFFFDMMKLCYWKSRPTFLE